MGNGGILEARFRFGDITRLLINVPPGFMKSLMTDVFWPAWEWGPLNKAHLRYVAFSYSASLTERDNDRFRMLVSSPDYQRLYGPFKTRRAKVKEDLEDTFVGRTGGVGLRNKTITKVMNTRSGWKLASSVGGVGTGERGDRIIIDDPHNVIEAESEIVRAETVRWFRESISSRFNNLDTGALVLIMQRVHYDDVSGVALSDDFDYCQFIVPWSFDPSRWIRGNQVIKNAIGWVDPRLDADDWYKNENEPAWPERFSEDAIARLKAEIGPYGFCNPGEAPVLMADLSLKRIDEIVVGDKIVGFETGKDGKRARLKPTEVLSISKSVQPVVRMALDSGKVIRCTANHKWFTGRLDATHKEYAPAHVGSKLKRVCPPTLPEVQTDEDIRLAGWVSGFFDGEGSVSLLQHGRGDHGNSLITFCQSADKNLPLCEKLEYSLTRLGFNFGYHERQPATLSAAGVPWQKRRSYYLKSDAGTGMLRDGSVSKRSARLELNQRFVHLIQPTKWRDRIIDTTVNGRMFTTSERVLDIKSDGVETVYGLETTTGNYVVWGLASSNSSQYQQAPVSRGEAIFKREYWKLWESPDDNFPPFDLIIGSLDGATTEKKKTIRQQ